MVVGIVATLSTVVALALAASHPPGDHPLPLLGFGCVGFQWWQKDSSYEASIWDLKTASSAGIISAAVTGTSYMPAIVVPIPIIARTKAAACQGLAKQLREFLVLAPLVAP